jgi:enamine deaminase RidA (YjgF/YER057c/UK114 family)
MPDIQRLNPDTMSRPMGYMHVVKTGNTVYIAGQIATAPDGSVVGKGDAEAQVRQIWSNIEAAVKSVGGSGIANLVKTTTYVTDIAHAGAVRKVREELFSSTQPPTSTLLVISELAGPDYLVEIEAIAVVD